MLDLRLYIITINLEGDWREIEEFLISLIFFLGDSFKIK